MTSKRQRADDSGIASGRPYRLLRLVKVILAILVSLLTLANLLGVGPG
jgi:hypothetical protein